MGYYAEIPAVVFDVQRVGPSTGMPTRVQQADILACAYASHGDTSTCCSSRRIRPSVRDGREAFDLAERFQTPVFVLSDLDIGMNDWVSPALEWDDDYLPDRGRVLTPPSCVSSRSSSDTSLQTPIRSQRGRSPA